MAESQASEQLRRTPLYDLHVGLGARMVPFAGYEMPVQYPTGIIAEHNWTRNEAGLFDVSHMGQAFLVGHSHDATARALEKLVPGDIRGLALGRIRYTQLTNQDGGIIDDLMVTRSNSPTDDGSLGLIVNASRKAADYEWIRSNLTPGISLMPVENRALIALQGPRAAEVIARHCPKAGSLAFMGAMSAEFDGIDCSVSRSGYTGEDGFEISVGARKAHEFVSALLAEPEVKPIGLGARDSLRLEAGLCLYGHDIDETTSPVEADLAWSIGKRRRTEGGYPGAFRIGRELTHGPARRRVGLRPEGRAPAREGTVVSDESGKAIGRITSGGFGPTVNGPVAMGYVEARFAKPGTPVSLTVRGTVVPARVSELPFISHNYKR
jgi:aminomethyltransferase